MLCMYYCPGYFDEVIDSRNDCLAENTVGQWNRIDQKAMEPKKRCVYSSKASTRENESSIQWAEVGIRRAGQWAPGRTSSIAVSIREVQCKMTRCPNHQEEPVDRISGIIRANIY